MKKRLAVVSALLLTLASLTGCSAFIAGVKEAYDKAKNEVKTLSVEDLSLQYTGSWSYDEPDGGKRINKNGKAVILVAFKELKVYENTFSRAFSAYDEYNDMENFKEVALPEAVDINGDEWYTISAVCLNEGKEHRHEQYFFSRGYELYRVTYTVPLADADVYEAEYKAIIGSMTLDNTEQLRSAAIAKAKLVGEWNWGEDAYAIFNEDNTYLLYKDRAKSPENVICGIYECSDKVATAAAGYEEGFTVIGTLVSVTMDGEAMALEPDSKIQYAFTPQDEDNVYTVTNLNTDNDLEVVKVK